ncbi:MAG: hypothetical protein AAFW65_06510 [Pseudomonadota bacterium]
MPRLFDAYIMVDWSAAAKPVTGPNSIWIGVLARDARLKFQFQAVNPDTRLKAREFLKDMIARLTKRGDRVLLGFDFSLGYPAGTADALGLKTDASPPWAAMHAHLAGKLKDKPDNSNPRFAIAAGLNYSMSKGPFPFWGAPAKEQVSTLAGKRPEFGADRPVTEYRTAEHHLRDSKRAQPKSCWQLAYTGSVGSQSLLGIPHIDHMRHEIEGLRVWPFETGLTAQTEDSLSETKVLIAEIYPSLLDVKPEAGAPIDRAQVEAVARHYCDLDGKGRLGPLFGPPEGLDMTKIPQIEREEGWILGA